MKISTNTFKVFKPQIHSSRYSYTKNTVHYNQYGNSSIIINAVIHHSKSSRMCLMHQFNITNLIFTKKKKIKLINQHDKKIFLIFTNHKLKTMSITAKAIIPLKLHHPKWVQITGFKYQI